MSQISIDVSDGIGSFPGVVRDVSRFGIGITDLPKRLDTSGKRMTIVVMGRGGHFKMRVNPRWSVPDGLRKNVGVEIPNAPWGWTEFVMGFEPADEDVWSNEINL
jgi:hypothetical protein